jgi:hypothetical protein
MEQNLEVQKRLNSQSLDERRSILQERQRLDQIRPKNKKQVLDVERHRAKMQRRCKHVFSQTSGRCEYCNKSRSAHI